MWVCVCIKAIQTNDCTYVFKILIWQSSDVDVFLLLCIKHNILVNIAYIQFYVCMYISVFRLFINISCQYYLSRISFYISFFLKMFCMALHFVLLFLLVTSSQNILSKLVINVSVLFLNSYMILFGCKLPVIKSVYCVKYFQMFCS